MEGLEIMLKLETLTKTGFLQYLEAPLHLWAATHERLEINEPAPFQQRLIDQGQAVEELAAAYLENLHRGGELQRQVSFSDGPYEARLDFLLRDSRTGVFDLYEVKSSTSVKKDHEYDLAFQVLVCDANIQIRDAYLVLVNRDYVRRGEIDPLQMFYVENMTEKVTARKEEVRKLRSEALAAILQETPEGLAGCLDPKTCPSLGLCHADLPAHPIFDLPRIGKKAANLIQMGIHAIDDIPDDFPLSEAQRIEVNLVKSGRPQIDVGGIRRFLAGVEYPLFFLDYETVNPALPLYDGYHPYDLTVFQYSLHIMERPGTEAIQKEFLALEKSDPAPQLAQSLSREIGAQGSVVVWNKSFEARCNRTLAQLAPDYTVFFEDVNARLFDLMEVFSKGLYRHPDFRGSASLKNILPVLVPRLAYEDLEIKNGEEAMQAWWEVVYGDPEPERRAALIQALRIYSTQDTVALVELWKELEGLL